MASSNSAESSQRKGYCKTRNGDGSGTSATPRKTRPVENQERRTFDNVLYYGTVSFVDYRSEKCYGWLTPSMPSKTHPLDTGSSGKNDVNFKVDAPGAADQSTSTMTGGMLLIRGDTLEYVLRMDNPRGPSTRRAKLYRCADRKMVDVLEYVKSLAATAQEHPDIVLRNVTRCPAPFEYVLAYDNPSDELLTHTLVLCQTLQRSRLLTEVCRSKLKQMYTLFCGSRFLRAETGVRKCCLLDGGDARLRNLLKDFLVHLLENIPSQLLQILPLLMRLAACEKYGTLDSIFTELGAGKQILPCEGGSFLMKVLNIVAGGRSERPGSQPWAQLPLLPTMQELVKLPNRGRDATLPVVRQKGPYASPEDYIDTYFRLLREDCFAGLLKGIQAFREGKLDDRDMKMWFGVATVGVRFNHTSSPGLTFAVRLPRIKKGGKASKAPKAPGFGSLVCFSDDGGSFDSPVWCVVRQCEEDADKACICFVDIVVQNGDQIELSSANSLSIQYVRLMKGEDMAMAESPTAYYAYQPVLDALQLTDPQTIPFKEELVSVKWPSKAPEYLNSASTTLDWSCIFERPPQGWFSRCLAFVGDSGVPASGEIREGVGGVKSLQKQGYITSFDACQLKAVELAVNNRLTIIQGPPGTGKTYVACKLLQLLLSASTFPEKRPILVITFKNHALDQFLEKCLTFCKGEDSIVRVGSRSKNENLEKYNLKNKINRDDEFRFELSENKGRTKEIQQEMESAVRDFNKCVLSFDPFMVISPELQLHYFMNRLAHPERVQAIRAGVLPEGFSLAEVLILDKCPEDLGPEWTTDILWLKQSLVAEIKRWMPKPEVFRTVQECFSSKKPPSVRSLQRVVSAATNATDNKAKATTVDDSDEEDDKEEQERRSAYESIRHDMKLEELDNKSPHGFEPRNKTQQWLQSDFITFSKERDVHLASVAYAHLDLDGSQFDWLEHGDPYNLSPERRAILVYKYWQRSVDVAWKRLASIKARFDTVLQDTEEIFKRRKLAILRKAKIIGITTTGAATLQTVLRCLSPAVILVEEAAEILEPNVLAVLNSNLQHLILIGDHEQLRPTIASYPLDRWHGFAVSMFERLVKHNKLPFQHLSRQCRMREEFVPMLLPIYPFLKTHTGLVTESRNKAPACMAKTMYFWAHTHQETSVRSYVNQGEADMVVALARWIISELQNTQGLKILAAYGGQVTIIQKMLEKYPDLKEVEVHTIDRFQGAESEIVIVSLVRSNPVGKIGYLSDRSRLCVAASRARSGVYFVGNHTTLTGKSADWKWLIRFFDSKQALSCSVPLRCPRHPSRPPYALNNIAASKFEPRDVCDQRCGEVLPCGHSCASTCHSGTHSLPCREPVKFTFNFCGHTHTKLCHQDHEQELACQTIIMHKFENCEHAGEVECWKSKGNRKLSLECKKNCGKTLKCGHICRLRCSDDCEGSPCKSCAKIEREKAKIQSELRAKAVEEKQKELEVEIQKLQEKANEGILRLEMLPHGDTAESYFQAKEWVEKLSIQPDNKTALVVTKVEKIENLQLQRKFLEAQRGLFSPLEIPKWLFYGGPDVHLEQVVNNGFKIPREQAAEAGYYFDVSSSTTAQEHDHGRLLLCEVHLGRTWRYPSDKDTINLISKLRDQRYDSLTLAADKDIEWESKRAHKHVIVNPEQAIPRFIVSYRLVHFQAPAVADGYETFGEQQASKTNGMCRLPLMPSSNFQEATPQEFHFQRAESYFLRQFDYSSIKRKHKVTKVEVVINLALKEKYLEKKKEFKRENLAVIEQWVFHGTDALAIDKIATQGFKVGGTEGNPIKFGAKFGHGVYIAMNPDISVPYCQGSKMMLLSIAIPGVRNMHHSFGHNEKVLVIKDVSQLLPRYVVHYADM